MVFGSDRLRYEVVEDWGRLPEGWSLGHVIGVAVGPRDDVYVLNRGEHPVIVFDSDGGFKDSWGEDVFNAPHGLYIDGHVAYVSDYRDHTVRKFTLAGELLAHRGEPTIVLTHNPVVIPTFQNSAAVARLVDCQPHALAVLAGHLHCDYEVRAAKLHLGAPMLVRPPYAFKVLRIYPDRILVFTHEVRDGAYGRADIYQKIDIPAACRLRRGAARRAKAVP